MSVFVSDFTTWTYIHDEAGHTGTLDPASISHPPNVDGSENPDFLVVTCPVCGASSTHPVGGGAQPPLVQQLFVKHAEMNGCPDGLASGQPSDVVTSHVKEHCEAMDGPGRWQVEATP